MHLALVIAVSWLLLSLLTAAVFAMLCRGGQAQERTRLP